MRWAISVLSLFRSLPSVSSLTHISLGGEEQNGVSNVVSVLQDVCMHLLHLLLAFSCLFYRTTVDDGKNAGWCCNQFVRVDASLDVRVNYVRLVGENNSSVIMSFTSVNRVLSLLLSHWLVALTRSHTHLTVIGTFQSNGRQAHDRVVTDSYFVSDISCRFILDSLFP